MPTVGRRKTFIRNFPTVAKTANSKAEMILPASMTSSPAWCSDPCRAILSPALAGLRTSTCSASIRSVCSTITTASTPPGTGAPVMMWTASPSLISSEEKSPAFISPTDFRRTGTFLTSSALTPYPSRIERSNGGWSVSSTMGSAMILLKHSHIETVSVGKDSRPTCRQCFNTISLADLTSNTTEEHDLVPRSQSFNV